MGNAVSGNGGSAGNHLSMTGAGNGARPVFGVSMDNTQTIPGNPEIAYDIPPPLADPNEGTWETPTRKYYGKKLPDGKLEKEKPYVHQDYPAGRYAQPGGVGTPIAHKLVHSKDEDIALGPGWEKTPAAFGYIGAPSRDELARLNQSPAQALIDAQSEKDAYARSEAAKEAATKAEAVAAEKLAEQRAADEAALEKRIADAVTAALAKQKQTLSLNKG